MIVNNTGYNGEEWSGGVIEATQPYPPSGALIVAPFNDPFKPTKPNYNILAVDTDKYVLIYDCENHGSFHTSNAWVLARDTSVDAATISDLEQILVSNGGDPTQFEKTNQKDCPPHLLFENSF